MKRHAGVSIGIFMMLLIIWELAALRMSQLVLPSPMIIMETLWLHLTSGYFLPHIGRTISEVLLGLLLGGLFGLTAGIVMGESVFFRKVLTPYLIASQAVPKLALAPLFILWFGFGMTSKVVITALVCFFPILENTMTGLKYSNKQQLDLFRMLGANKWQILFQLKIPAGIPAIIAGFRVGVVLALVGAVVGEFIGGSEGLGAVIIASQGMMDTPLMFSSLILLTALGMMLYQTVNLIENKYFAKYIWRQR
ncbi:ABC transporter permease [Bacillus mesophilum]|uniref:ABC transporter permease n=1 Tax=Bacillus mesophilum TaxID=1071718 RepID=A0A7V7RQQ8_9BACI|nr:ABC transporter permease [Bacillus mesophilum]KAB2335832.1 ABC transporter permease [Bacillus mesophilum]